MICLLCYVGNYICKHILMYQYINITQLIICTISVYFPLSVEKIRANVDLNCLYQNVSVPLQVISVLFFLICTPGNTHRRVEWTKHLAFSFLSTKLRWRIVSILMVTVTHLTIVCWEWCDEGVSIVHVYSGLYDCSSLALHCWLGLSGLSLPTAVVTIL